MFNYIIIASCIVASVAAATRPCLDCPNWCLCRRDYKNVFGFVCDCEQKFDGPYKDIPVLSLGCYAVNLNHVLDVQLLDSPTNTPFECFDRCHTYTFSGVQFGNECYCGNELIGNPETVPESECDMNCPVGDEKCGGSLRISVYKAG